VGTFTFSRARSESSITTISHAFLVAVGELVVSINKRAARPGFTSGCFPLTRRYACSEVKRANRFFYTSLVTTRINGSLEDSKQGLSRMFVAAWVTSSANLGVMLFKPGLEPVSGLFSWIRLPLRLVEFGAIRQILMNRRAAVLLHEIAPGRCAASSDPCSPPI
jgi:hypothetical protein